MHTNQSFFYGANRWVWLLWLTPDDPTHSTRWSLGRSLWTVRVDCFIKPYFFGASIPRIPRYPIYCINRRHGVCDHCLMVCSCSPNLFPMAFGGKMWPIQRGLVTHLWEPTCKPAVEWRSHDGANEMCLNSINSNHPHRLIPPDSHNLWVARAAHSDSVGELIANNRQVRPPSRLKHVIIMSTLVKKPKSRGNMTNSTTTVWSTKLMDEA